MRSTLLRIGSLWLLLWASVAGAQTVDPEVDQMWVVDFPSMPFAQGASGPFSVHVEQRHYRNGGQGLRAQRDYLRWESERLLQGSEWRPMSVPMLADAAEEYDDFGEQAAFHLLYRFHFD